MDDSGYCARTACGQYGPLDSYLRWCRACIHAWQAEHAADLAAAAA